MATRTRDRHAQCRFQIEISTLYGNHSTPSSPPRSCENTQQAGPLVECQLQAPRERSRLAKKNVLSCWEPCMYVLVSIDTLPCQCSNLSTMLHASMAQVGGSEIAQRYNTVTQTCLTTKKEDEVGNPQQSTINNSTRHQ